MSSGRWHESKHQMMKRIEEIIIIIKKHTQSLCLQGDSDEEKNKKKTTNMLKRYLNWYLDACENKKTAKMLNTIYGDQWLSGQSCKWIQDARMTIIPKFNITLLLDLMDSRNWYHILQYLLFDNREFFGEFAFLFVELWVFFVDLLFQRHQFLIPSTHFILFCWYIFCRDVQHFSLS